MRPSRPWLRYLFKTGCFFVFAGGLLLGGSEVFQGFKQSNQYMVRSGFFFLMLGFQTLLMGLEIDYATKYRKAVEMVGDVTGMCETAHRRIRALMDFLWTMRAFGEELARTEEHRLVGERLLRMVGAASEDACRVGQPDEKC